MNLDKNLAISGGIIGIVVVLWGAASAWGGLNARVETIAKQVEAMVQEDHDSLCQQLVMRQVAAIEKDAKPVINRLGVMAEEYGCLRRFANGDAMTVDSGEEVSWTSDDTPTDAAHAAAVEAKAAERLRLLRDLRQVDEALFPEAIARPVEMPSWLEGSEPQVPGGIARQPKEQSSVRQ